MNGAHLHLILAHVAPIGGAFTLLLFIFALAGKNKELKQTALWFAFLTGVAAFVTYLTGDGAEGYAKAIPGIVNVKELIESHENFALFYMIAACIIGVAALAGLFLSRASDKILHRFVIIVFVLTILSSYFSVMTSLTGGKIRHNDEIIGKITAVEDDD